MAERAEDFKDQKQPLSEGVGPAFHRRFRVELETDMPSARRAMAKLKSDINSFSPQWLAKFEKTKGPEGELRPGDCFQIYLPGPWNGPVRVKEESEDSFCLLTLRGHMEAGEIHFSIAPVENKVCFTVESLARSGDFLVDLIYDKIPIARFIQTEMWEKFCEAFAKEALTGRQDLPPVQVTTEKTDEQGNWQPA